MVIEPLDPNVGFSFWGSAFASFDFFASLENLSFACCWGAAGRGGKKSGGHGG